jgi:hypothetical protein
MSEDLEEAYQQRRIGLWPGEILRRHIAAISSWSAVARVMEIASPAWSKNTAALVGVVVSAESDPKNSDAPSLRRSS